MKTPKGKRIPRVSDRKPSTEETLLPFHNFEEWLKWKRQQEEPDDTYHPWFYDPEDPDAAGYDDLHYYDWAEIASQIPDAIGPITGNKKNDLLLARKLGVALAAITGRHLNVEYRDVRVDLNKMMRIDAVKVLLSELGVKQSRPDFYQQWSTFSDDLLSAGTQLDDYKKGAPAENPFIASFCRTTYSILKRNTRLTARQIQTIQKQLYLHFLLNHSFLPGLDRGCSCRYVKESDGWYEYCPKYQGGRLVEERCFCSDTVAKPGNLQELNDNCWYCPHFKKVRRKGASHCDNGNLCFYIDKKIDKWYRRADPAVLET